MGSIRKRCEVMSSHAIDFYLLAYDYMSPFYNYASISKPASVVEPIIYTNIELRPSDRTSYYELGYAWVAP